MRQYKSACGPLAGAMALAMLFVNTPTPADATTETPAPAAARAPEAPVTSPEPAPAAADADKSAPAAPASPASTAEAPAKPKPQPPTLIARINLSTQTMVVQAGSKTIHTWKVSTGAPGYATPPGTFRPGWMAKMWNSRQYDDAPMPYSVFFNGGIAVHGTMNPGSLGRAASHGCVRVATSNAATFFRLVSKHGMANTRIIVHGAQPFSRYEAVAARNKPRQIRSSTQWVYAANGPATQRQRLARPAGGQGQLSTQQPRRMTSARTASPYWARY